MVSCGPLWIFADRYGFVMHPSKVTAYANTEIVAQHRHYKAILIVIRGYYMTKTILNSVLHEVITWLKPY